MALNGDRSCYRIRIRGHLDATWSEWFGGLTIGHRDDGTTVLSGPITDQAMLYGLLQRARDLGLTLLAVEQLPCDDAGEGSSGVPGRL